MGGSVPYTHLVMHFPVLSRPNIGNHVFTLKEIENRLPIVSSIRADGNRRDRSSPRGDRAEESHPQSFDSGSLASSKEEILALFKRIQLSISKGDSANSKKKTTKPTEEKPSAESLLEVLRQSKTHGKGRKVSGSKVDRLPAQNNELTTKQESIEDVATSAIDLKMTRPPSSFTRRSPITAPSNSREKIEVKSETMPTVSDNELHKAKKYEDMKLTELKEAAKSKGIKGYSKLKKSEIVELLIRA